MEKTKILIVESEAKDVLEFESHLKNLGYDVTSICDTGDKAVEKAGKEKPDIVLMDIRIKGKLDAIEVADIIRSKYNIPVIFSTAGLDDQKIEQAKTSMPFAYVCKPIQERDLKTAIELALYVESVNSERDKTNKQLKKNLELLETTLESTADAILVVDDKGGVLHYNKNFTELWRIPESILGVEDDNILLEFVLSQLKDPNAFLTKVKYLYGSSDKDFDNLEFIDGRLIERFSRPLLGNGAIGGRVWSFRDVTERKQAKEALSLSQNRYKELVNLLPQVVFETDEKGGLTFVNSFAFDLFGYTQADFDKGLNAIQMVVPEEQEQALFNFSKVLNGKQIGGSEYRMQKKEGTIFPVILHSTRIIRDGNPVGLRGIIIDITSHKRTERKYRQIFENALTPYYEASLEGIMLEVSPSVERYLQYKREELIGKSILDLYADPHQRDKFIKKLQKTGELQDEEILVKDKNGSVHHGLLCAKYVQEDQKIVGSLLDISKRKQSEEALRDSEEKYRSVVENANEAIFILQKNTFKYLNSKTCELSGYTEEELLAKSFLDIVHPDDREMIKDRYVRRQNGEILDDIYAFKVIRKQKDVIWVEIKPVIIQWESKVATLCFISDITKRINALQALEKSEAGYRSFVQIGLALSVESDINILLEMILNEARKLSNADAGTLYLMDNDGMHLRFEILQNDSMHLRMGGTTGNVVDLPKVQMYTGEEPNYSNVSSYAALTGEITNIKDVYTAADRFDFTGPMEYDKTTGYRTTSMLVIPMKDHEGETIGVLQLINSIDKETNSVIPFASIYVDLVSSLASQAAVALNNAQLSEDLKNSFYAFIKSTAAAIDEKSAYTGGHIRRVVDLTMRISEEINQTEEGPFKDTHFDENEIEELRLAAWMHDVGKITTPEYVVDKSTKLETIFDCINLVETRFQLIEKTIENDFLQKKIDLLSNADTPESDLTKLDQELSEALNCLHEEIGFLKKCNQPGEFLSEENIDHIKNIGLKTYSYNGQPQPYLNQKEIYNLTIPKGSLTTEERKIIENHSYMSYQILKEIPFPKKMAMVPEYASAHHEKLDGSGYHQGFSEKDLSLQSRIIAVADIFEALTAKDRPYRTPMNLSQAIKILGFMKNDKHIDPNIYNLFIENMLYREYAMIELNPEQVDISLAEEA